MSPSSLCDSNSKLDSLGDVRKLLDSEVMREAKTLQRQSFSKLGADSDSDSAATRDSKSTKSIDSTVTESTVT